MICLVTDRRRLAGGDLAGRSMTPSTWESTDHVRERDPEAAALAALTPGFAHHGRHAVRLVVNDRSTWRAGVRRGWRATARRFDASRSPRCGGCAGRVPIGRSVHGVDQAIAAADADYLVAGRCFGIEGRRDPLLGVDGLR